MGLSWQEKKAALILIVLQGLFLALLGGLGRYDTAAADSRTAQRPEHLGSARDFVNRYGLFQDIHVMVFVGFGFLMAFLHRYSFSAVGFNFLLGSVVIQWSIIIQGLLAMAWMRQDRIFMNTKTMIRGEYAAATVLISFGVLLGTCGPLQLTVMSMVEIVFYAVNAFLCEDLMQVADAGNSMLIHMFGAYFGLACAFIMQRKGSMEGKQRPKTRRHTPQEERVERKFSRVKHVTYVDVMSTYNHDLFAMFGTIFLWMCWPSFNAALLDTHDQQARVAINTYCSLVACVVVTFAVTLLVSKMSHLEMPLIQNSTLAGGVAVGTMCNFMIHPWGACLVGIIAAVVSVLGFHYISRLLETHLGVHDTCGVHNLHGMPGLVGALSGIIAAGCAGLSTYGPGLANVFPARTYDPVSRMVTGRSAGAQAGIQIAGLLITLVFAIGGGVACGFLLKLKVWQQVHEDETFKDDPFWEVPGELAKYLDSKSANVTRDTNEQHVDSTPA